MNNTNNHNFYIKPPENNNTKDLDLGSLMLVPLSTTNSYHYIATISTTTNTITLQIAAASKLRVSLLKLWFLIKKNKAS